MNIIRIGYYLGILIAFISGWYCLVWGLIVDEYIFINIGTIELIFLIVILAVYVDKSILKPLTKE